MSKDRFYMNLAIELAKKGRYFTSPNPMVGAVCVKDDKIIALDFHEKFGELHAERRCLLKRGVNFSGASLYVNLEPCSHYGKTPPCTKIIIEKGISKVFVSHRDPNPLVKGFGIKKLKENGIKVYEGVLKEKAELLNQAFICNIKEKRSYVTLKMALTLDGKLAVSSGDSKYITDNVSLSIVHSIRAESDAILVGGGTVRRDDPELTVRKRGLNKRIKKVIITKTFNLEGKTSLFKSGDEVIFVVDKKYRNRINSTSFNGNFKILTYDFKSKDFLKELLSTLYNDFGVGRLLVEGGAFVSSLFLKSGVVDKIVFFISTIKIVGGTVSPFKDFNLERMDESLKLYRLKSLRLKDDFYVEGLLNVYRVD